MRFKLFCSILLCIAGAQIPVSAQVVEVKNNAGGVLITNSPAVASSGKELKKIDTRAEGYIFPVKGQKNRRSQKAQRILTGVFSGSGEKTAVSSDNPGDLPDIIGFDQAPVKRQTKRDAETIAWVTKTGAFYHDPFLECALASGTERIWVGSVKELNGLEPCSECYQKNNNVPEFIRKESGGLDVATATTLLSNADFLVWVQERLPLRNPGFITSQKLMIYPKMEMTRKGLHQLARETELAYRRKVWKVIEVVAKQSEADLDHVSSFDTDVTDETPAGEKADD